MQRLELHDVVRVARLDRADRPYDGSEGSMRAPRIGDEGTVVLVGAKGAASGTVMVERVAADGTTIWLANFAVDELEPTEDTLQRWRQRTVRRTRRWIVVALALAGGSTGFTFLRDRIAAGLSMWLTVIVALALFVASLSDLGRAHGSQPGATSLDQEVGFLLQAPRILVGLAGVAGGAVILHHLFTSKLVRMDHTPFVVLLAIGLALLAGGIHLLLRLRRTR